MSRMSASSRIRLLRAPLLCFACLALCGFSVQKAPNIPVGQPKDERQAQDALPKSHDPMWAVLGKTRIHENEKLGLFSATYPPQVKALVGRQVTISGFMLPLESSEKFKHFILSKRTPTCPFCPPGEPNEIVDVQLVKPTGWNENLVKVTGTFELMNNAELGMFFRLKNAKRL
jgi:hypothetical protein